jgi:tyrosyl-DNA phosphodiesterase 2
LEFFVIILFQLEAIGGLPNDVYDLWQSTGARKECLYTWDCLRNNNLVMNGKFKPRCRFDRMFYRRAKIDNEELRLSPVYFELEGLEKLKSCSRFCSDHWAIQCYFDLIAS